MKKLFSLILAIIIFCSLAGCKGGGNSQSGSSGKVHTHEYTLVKPQKSTCSENGHIIYYTCDCGKIFVKKGAIYVETTPDAVLLNKTEHSFTGEVVSDKYFKEEATEESPQTFYKSCALCGEKSVADTFTFGKTLAEYAEEEKSLYAPTNLTMTLYDAANCVYGFTWNTEVMPARPVITVKKVASGEEKSLRAEFAVANSFKSEGGRDVGVNYYSCKAKICLEPNTEYVYSVGDKYLNTYTEKTSIKTVDAAETGSWKFVHVSDSQAEGNVADGGSGTGDAFSNVLKSVSDLSGLRFMVHTGDVVEYSKYQSYWTNMLNANIKYLSKIPVMTISGNHETTYKNGVNETFNRFNYKIPQQQTDLGFYYSFSYANVKFIMLNTNRLNNLKLTADQYNWLENELKNKTEKWTIVTMHNPIYSVGKYGSDTGNNAIAHALTEQLSGLFACCKVDVVLQGHDHMISRTHPINAEGKATGENVDEIDGINYINNPDGVIYVMNGPAGNQARSEIFGHDESLYAYAQASQPSSWAEFEVSGDRLTVKVKSAHTGSSADIVSWGIKKSA